MLALASSAQLNLQREYECKLLSRTTKNLLYKTLVVQVLLYTLGALVLSRSSENALRTFETNIYTETNIHKAVKEGGDWRRRTNEESLNLPNTT